MVSGVENISAILFIANSAQQSYCWGLGLCSKNARRGKDNVDSRPKRARPKSMFFNGRNNPLLVFDESNTDWTKLNEWK